MKHLADEFVAVVKSPDPERIYCYSPGICVLPTGRLVATMDFGGPGVKDMQGHVDYNGNDRPYIGEVFLSDDGGKTWRHTATRSLFQMRPFLAGGPLYALGHAGDLAVIRSDDDGETWSGVHLLTSGQKWHQAPSNVWYKGDCVYLVMERRMHDRTPWAVCAHAPVLMRAKVTDDLTRRESWTFASEIVFEENVDENNLPDWGIPFMPNVPGGNLAGIHMGWLETNVVQLLKKNDWFYDPTGKTFHLFMRQFTGLSWTGSMLKVVEQEDGSMLTQFEYAPSGKRMVFTRIPGGGESKFHILYDEKTQTYWLLTNEKMDSMVDSNKMTPRQRSGYDRSRLVLYYSLNCFDWIFAGVVAAGHNLYQSRSYASMAFCGEDLLVLSRTGDENAYNGHDTNIISFHRVKHFRDLIDAEW